MYKVIIADDEQRIRRGMINTIPWEEFGFQVIADFMDGQDVLDYLETHEAEVVFTDVRMCQVSGLEVAKWIRNNRPTMRVVMISGYKEFDYVQEAIRQGTLDYILKPVELNEVTEVLKKIRTILDKEHHENIELLRDCRKDPACLEAETYAQELVEAVFSANDASFTKSHRMWRITMMDVKREYVPLMVFSMIDRLCGQMDAANIHLDAEWSKDSLIQRIGKTEEGFLLEEMKIILYGLYQQIKERKSTQKDDMVNKAMKYIDSHLSESLSVEEVAEYVGFNRSYFSREFKAKSGENVTDHILRKRIEKASALMKSGEHSPSKLAAAVGYSDVKYFQKIFKQYTGYSIREYRNLIR